MTADEAADYHRTQTSAFAAAGAELVTAVTMTYADEAIGVVRAAAADGLPVVVSFTTETDGRLPSGQPLAEAVTEVDEATDGAAAYFMVNCAHPTHFPGVLDEGGPWPERVKGVRANSSTKSHAELDEATELDRGDIPGLARHYGELHRLPARPARGRWLLRHRRRPRGRDRGRAGQSTHVTASGSLVMSTAAVLKW